MVLFAWELGSGAGHIQRMLPIARELAARDCRVVFALRRLENADSITRELPGAKVRRAPFHSTVDSFGLRLRAFASLRLV